MHKTAENFGSNSFVGETKPDPGLFEQTPADQARYLGWIEGCPVVEELITARGPEQMIKRYSEISFWQGHIRRELEAKNPTVYEVLTTPVKRLPGEPVGKHEEVSVPILSL